jgi:hypothetical protein
MKRMKNFKKRILATVLAAAMVIPAGSVAVGARVPPTVAEGVGWNFDGVNSLLISTNVGTTGWRNGRGAAFELEDVTEVEFTGRVTSIGLSAFRRCTGLVTMEIPDTITTISNLAFDGCTNLETIVIGSGVTSIGDNVFDNCDKLTSIMFKSMTPPTFGTNVFSSRPVVYIPRGAQDAYNNSETLKGFHIVTSCFGINCGTCNVCVLGDPNVIVPEFVTGRILPGDNRPVQIGDALEILKFLAGMGGSITPNSRAWNAALITPASQSTGIPGVTDALEILKFLAGMDSLIK